MMRKHIMIALLFLLALSSVSYGAVSQDMSVYVRQDVFDAKMEGINSKLDEILEEMKTQRKEINALTQSVAVLSERVDGNYKNLDTRMNDLRNGLYLGLVLFAAVLILPFFNKWWELREAKREQKSQSVTLEDVKRLIATAITEAQLSSGSQA